MFFLIRKKFTTGGKYGLINSESGATGNLRANGQCLSPGLIGSLPLDKCSRACKTYTRWHALSPRINYLAPRVTFAHISLCAFLDQSPYGEKYREERIAAVKVQFSSQPYITRSPRPANRMVSIPTIVEK